MGHLDNHTLNAMMGSEYIKLKHKPNYVDTYRIKRMTSAHTPLGTKLYQPFLKGGNHKIWRKQKQ
jgi:hypothetical protein